MSVSPDVLTHLLSATEEVFERMVFTPVERQAPIDDDADRFARITAFALLILGGGLILAVVVQVLSVEVVMLVV